MQSCKISTQPAPAPSYVKICGTKFYAHLTYVSRLLKQNTGASYRHAENPKLFSICAMLPSYNFPHPIRFNHPEANEKAIKM